MLSQVKKRLYPRFLENAFISHSVSRFSSKKGPKEPFVTAQKSAVDENPDVDNAVFEKSIMPQKNKFNVSDQHSDVFDAVLKASFASKKKPEKRFSTARPGRLNVEMAKAANNVADMAGKHKSEVLDDIMDKLETVFPGMNNHTKGIKKTSARDKRTSSKDGGFKQRDRKTDKGGFFDASEDNFDDVVGQAFSNAASKTSKAGGFKKSDGKTDRSGLSNASEAYSDDLVGEAFSNAVFKDLPNNRRSEQFKGEPFTDINTLLKSQKTLGIFTSNLTHTPSLSMWEKFEQEQLKRSTNFEPLNWFDQCITWTEEGKLWNFPIDNEQGMDKEAEVDFSEHIFLDHHAESWCPREGPIKYFMELVLVGLSKNPYITVEEKIDTINWYGNYFKDNQKLLEEINAFGSPEDPIEVEGKMS